MWLLFLLLMCPNVWAVQQTMPNGDVVDIEKNVTYLITPGASTLAAQAAQEQLAITQQAQQAAQIQLNDLRQKTLKDMADAQIASNLTTAATAASLKQQGAQ